MSEWGHHKGWLTSIFPSNAHHKLQMRNGLRLCPETKEQIMHLYVWHQDCWKMNEWDCDSLNVSGQWCLGPWPGSSQSVLLCGYQYNSDIIIQVIYNATLGGATISDFIGYVLNYANSSSLVSENFWNSAYCKKGSPPPSLMIHPMANLNVLRLVLCCYEGCSAAEKYFAAKQWRHSRSLLIWNNYNYHGIFCNIKLGTNTLQNPLHAIPDPQASRLSGRAPWPWLTTHFKALNASILSLNLHAGGN